MQAETSESRRPGFGIDSIIVGDRRVAIRERVLMERPFGRLLRFERSGSARLPRVLLAAPLSGNFAILLRDMICALLPDHDVHLADWADAREVPAAAGGFGLEENITYVVDFLRHLGPGVHLIGLCQSVVPALSATAALAAADDSCAPASLTLTAGPVDCRVNTTKVARLIGERPLSWFEERVIAPVPAPWPGAGRPVYPSDVQRAGFLMYLTRHMATGLELQRKVWLDDGQDPRNHPFLGLYLSLMDLPAEVFLDTMRLVFHEAALPQGKLTWRGQAIDPSAIRNTALMTIEGQCDDIAAPGQTAAAHDLCPLIPAAMRVRHVEAAVGHFGTFHGERWRLRIAPRLTAFIRENDRRPTAAAHPRRRPSPTPQHAA